MYADQPRHPPAPRAAGRQRRRQIELNERALDVVRGRRSCTTATRSAWATTSSSATATACARRLQWSPDPHAGDSRANPSASSADHHRSRVPLRVADVEPSREPELAALVDQADIALRSAPGVRPGTIEFSRREPQGARLHFRQLEDQTVLVVATSPAFTQVRRAWTCGSFNRASPSKVSRPDEIPADRRAAYCSPWASTLLLVSLASAHRRKSTRKRPFSSRRRWTPAAAGRGVHRRRALPRSVGAACLVEGAGCAARTAARLERASIDSFHSTPSAAAADVEFSRASRAVRLPSSGRSPATPAPPQSVISRRSPRGRGPRGWWTRSAIQSSAALLERSGPARAAKGRPGPSPGRHGPGSQGDPRPTKQEHTPLPCSTETRLLLNSTAAWATA